MPSSCREKAFAGRWSANARGQARRKARESSRGQISRVSVGCSHCSAARCNREAFPARRWPKHHLMGICHQFPPASVPSFFLGIIVKHRLHLRAAHLQSHHGFFFFFFLIAIVFQTQAQTGQSYLCRGKCKQASWRRVVKYKQIESSADVVRNV